MKRVLMRTHEHRYFGQPGVEFACPDEVVEELQRLDKRAFQVQGDITQAEATKLFGATLKAEKAGAKEEEEMQAELDAAAEERRRAEENLFDESEEEPEDKTLDEPPQDRAIDREKVTKK